ncbi:MAG: OPT/YSL family transporter [Phycisphaerae bacterium]
MSQAHSPRDSVPAAAASPAAPTAAPHGSAPLPLDLTSAQLTLRALLTGCLLGAVLSACNIYTGLTIGWGLNMSLTAVLLSYGFWQSSHALFGTRKWTMLENNVNQTACSSAAAVSSAGLVAPIPALTMINGTTLDWIPLSIWVFAVCMVGITVAIPLRRQMILVDKLPFPSGIANAEMLREMYARGVEAVARLTAMLTALGFATLIAVLHAFPFILHALVVPFTFVWPRFQPQWVTLAQVGLPIPAAWLGGFSARSLTLALDPSPLFIAVGGLIGIRGCISLAIGSILAWAVIAPTLINHGAIRLRVSEPLAVLPAGVADQLPREPDGFTEYKPEVRQLAHRGVMTPQERDRLIGLSEDAAWREVVGKLFVRSQIRIATPLAGLPAGVALAESPLQYDADARELRIRRVNGASVALSPDDYTRLSALSDDPAYRTALAALYANFNGPTTRRMQFRVTVPEWPGDLNVPPGAAHRVRFEHAQRRLVCEGRMDDAARTALLERLAERRAAEPAEAPALDAIAAAVAELAEISQRPVNPRVPGGVEYDEPTATFRVQGPIAAAVFKDALPAGDPNRDYLDATAATLAAASAYRPVAPTFPDVVGWLLWPGVTLMVVSSLVSFGFSGGAVVRLLRGGKSADPTPRSSEDVPMKLFAAMFVVSLALAVFCQVQYYGILIWAAVLGVLLSYVLALVAARVSGETNTTPVGAMGKVTQLVFGALMPASPAANLMTANVTGGAASQCADLMHDLKTGYLIGASPRKQALAQYVGALVGSFAGAMWYLVLIPHPKEQLMTAQYAAPAVATWKAVAELFMVGFRALPEHSVTAIIIAGVLGALLPVLDRVLPRRVATWLPSPAALGLAFVVPGNNALSMFLGGVLALVVTKLFKSFAARFLIAICAGLIAGESLTNVGIALGRLPFWSGLFGS